MIPAIAASFFTEVDLIAVIGEDFGDDDVAIFRGRKIDTAGLERAAGKCFFWAGRYLTQAAHIAGNWVMPVMSIGQIAEIGTMAILGFVLKRFA